MSKTIFRFLFDISSLKVEFPKHIVLIFEICAVEFKTVKNVALKTWFFYVNFEYSQTKFLKLFLRCKIKLLLKITKPLFWLRVKMSTTSDFSHFQKLTLILKFLMICIEKSKKTSKTLKIEKKCFQHISKNEKWEKHKFHIILP